MNLKNKFRILRKQAGFTLVELIVVIAIIAVLGGVAVPAYSGYIEKTRITADKQLLADVNKAFISACMMAGESNINHPEAKDQKIDGNGILTYDGPNAEYFNNFYEGGNFEVATYLEYDKDTGAFTAPELDNGNVYNKISELLKDKFSNELKLLNDSNFGDIGAEALLTEVGSVVNWANGFGLAEQGGENFMNALKGYLGLDATADDTAVRDAMLKLAGNDGSLATQISTNAVALYAAQNTAGVTTESISAWMGKTTNDLQSNKSANTLSEAAAIYGLYMSYAESKGETFDNKNGNTIDVMGAALSDSGFATWVNSDAGKAELNAYKASMAIVNGAAEDDATRNAVLINGFDDPELIKVMESLMGK